MAAKVEKIIVRKSPADGSSNLRPMGYYHVFKCYDEARGDMWPIAFIDISEGRNLPYVIAYRLAKKYDCPIKWKKGQSNE